MSTTIMSHRADRDPRIALALIGALIAIELLTTSILYKHVQDFTCRDMAPAWACAMFGRAVPRSVGIIAALALFCVARPGVVSALFRDPRLSRGMTLHLAGIAFVLTPILFLSDAVSGLTVASAFAIWLLGAALAGIGTARMIATWPVWRESVATNAWALGGLIGVGFLLPEIGDLLKPLWQIEAVTEITFRSVAASLELLGYDVQTDIADKVIGSRDFFVRVAAECSGVEGFALVTAFVTLYLALFHRDLRFPMAFLLYPIGLAASWAFNIIRIVVLLAIGIEGSPELAVGGFHSHAGWLAFTLLSIGLIGLSRAIPAFSAVPVKSSARAGSSFFADPVVAQLFPFIVFMASALLASTFFADPARAYPLRAAAMAVALWLVWPWFRALSWRFDPLSALTGVVIGIGWIVMAPAADGPGPLAGMGAIGAMFWVATRIAGTAIFVPLIEEALFRGYMIDRIAPSRGTLQTVLAIAVSAALFAVLHDRWIAAAFSGLIFGLLVWRSRNLTDAIVAHAGANAAIAAWAVATGAWHVI